MTNQSAFLNVIISEPWTFRGGVYFSYNLLLLATAIWIVVLFCRSLVMWRKRDCPAHIARRLGVLGFLFGLANTTYLLLYAFAGHISLSPQDYSFWSFLDDHPDIRIMIALQCFGHLSSLYYGILILIVGLLESYFFEFMNWRRNVQRDKDQVGTTTGGTVRR